MKKISRKDLQGLRRQFPVLSKDDMRHYVGGYDGGGYFSGGTGYGWGDGYGDFGGGSGGYWGGSSDNYYDNVFNYWLASGNYFYDENGNFFWSNGDYFTDAYGNPFMYGGNIYSDDTYGGNYTGQGRKDCSIQSIAAITGLSVEILHRYASQVIQRELNVSAGYADVMAGLPLKASEIEAVLEMAGGECFNVYINGGRNVTFTRSIGLINHHVVKVVSYDSSTGLIHWIDPQNNNVQGSAPLSSFNSIKSFSDYDV